MKRSGPASPSNRRLHASGLSRNKVIYLHYCYTILVPPTFASGGCVIAPSQAPWRKLATACSPPFLTVVVSFSLLKAGSHHVDHKRMGCHG
jgi:hypothetical protein